MIFDALLIVPVVIAVAWTIIVSLQTGVPPYPSSRAEAADVIALLAAAAMPDRPLIYELGCGFGGLASRLAEAFPNARVVGIERSPVPCLFAWIRSRGRYTVRWADFSAMNLSDADAVTAYLMIAPMVPLQQQLRAQLRAATPIVTLTFWFRGRAPETKRGRAALYRA